VRGRRTSHDIAPPPFRDAHVCRDRRLRKLCEIGYIAREFVAVIFDRLIQLKRRSLIAAKPIDLLAQPNQPLRLKR
jgi:hypothetical protein